MTKYLRISSYIRKPFLKYDFATDPILNFLVDENQCGQTQVSFCLDYMWLKWWPMEGVILRPIALSVSLGLGPQVFSATAKILMNPLQARILELESRNVEFSYLTMQTLYEFRKNCGKYRRKPWENLLRQSNAGPLLFPYPKIWQTTESPLPLPRPPPNNPPLQPRFLAFCVHVSETHRKVRENGIKN